jgi:hypothetical protein
MLLVFFVSKTESYLKIIPCPKSSKGLSLRFAMGSENMLASPQLRNNLDDPGTSTGHSFLQSQDHTIGAKFLHSVTYPRHQGTDVDKPTLPPQTWNLLDEALDIHLKNRFCPVQTFGIDCIFNHHFGAPGARRMSCEVHLDAAEHVEEAFKVRPSPLPLQRSRCHLIIQPNLHVNPSRSTLPSRAGSGRHHLRRRRVEAAGGRDPPHRSAEHAPLGQHRIHAH